jgi:site-specific DNA-methyltransferase (adenine-specific)
MGRHRYTLDMTLLEGTDAARLIADLGVHDLVIEGDNLAVLPLLPMHRFQLIYIDPPFNTGTRQQRKVLQTHRDETGDRIGFGGNRYRTEETSRSSYEDSFDDYPGFLHDRITIARDLLTESGTMYVHVDAREAHYVKVMLDGVFGRECFLNEIIWAYDYGGRAKNRWPAKHDTILVYVRTAGGHFFDSDAVDRIPYMAPGLVSVEKAARGKLPTDVWWHTIVPTNGREKTGYPTQKPEGILRRIMAASSRPGDLVLDFFAGSGTTGAVAAQLKRRFALVDANHEAIAIMRKRLPADTCFLATKGAVDLVDSRSSYE